MSSTTPRKDASTATPTGRFIGPALPKLLAAQNAAFRYVEDAIKNMKLGTGPPASQAESSIQDRDKILGNLTKETNYVDELARRFDDLNAGKKTEGAVKAQEVVKEYVTPGGLDRLAAMLDRMEEMRARNKKVREELGAYVEEQRVLGETEGAQK